MARPGQFDPELSKSGMFDAEMNPGGLFAPEFITNGAVGSLPPMTWQPQYPERVRARDEVVASGPVPSRLVA